MKYFPVFVLLGLSVTGAGLSAPTPAPRWVKMPLLSPEAKAAGVSPGGEGAQWPRGPVAVSPADPNFLLLPIDVGGLYRSLDGGKTWNVSMAGWDARGANGFAIDPKNAKHVLGIGGNSMNWDAGWGPSPNGVYLSSDKAASWTHTLAVGDGQCGSVVFDPTSFDIGKGICTVAYYAAPLFGLYRTADGGHTWMRVSDIAVTTAPDQYNAPFLAVHPTKGWLYVAGKGGLSVSKDGGKTFTPRHGGNLWGLSVVPARPDQIVVSGEDGLLVSQDAGETWTALPAAGLDRRGGKAVRNVAVSPVNPDRMTVWVAGDNYDWPRFASDDGGKTFTASVTDKGFAPLPMNSRQGLATWSPSDPNVVYNLGGDWVTKSTDGGHTFRWAGNGYNGVMTGGLFNFSPRAPGVVMLGFQDYNGAFTTDGGATWNCRDVSGKGWGGHEYGALALSVQTMWTGDADSWSTPRRLRLSRDGGQTWAFVNGPDGQPLAWQGADVSFADPDRAAIGFASDLRTADGGATWARMDGCEGVFAAAAHGLYGKKGNAVVRSTDGGASWQKVADVDGGVMDLAVDPKSGTVYAASQDTLKAWNGTTWTVIDTPADQFGNRRVWTVAVDPKSPNVLYVGGPRNTYASHATVCRSTDGGHTWVNLTVNAPGQYGTTGGPHEVSAIRVDPRTRAAWVAGQCYGLWRIAPPAASEKGQTAALASAPRAVVPLPTSAASVAAAP